MLTQFLLKQSCEQKKLALPSFWHVGHCSDDASFGQSIPKHFRFVDSVAVIFEICAVRQKVRVARLGECESQDRLNAQLCVL
jgi:hypothetical protein